MSRIFTILEAHVPPEQQAALRDAYHAAARDVRPPGLLRSALLQAIPDPSLWRIETVWESRAALEAMRSTGMPPRGIAIFRAAGAEPKVSIFEAVEEIS